MRRQRRFTNRVGNELAKSLDRKRPAVSRSNPGNVTAGAGIERPSEIRMHGDCQLGPGLLLGNSNLITERRAPHARNIRAALAGVEQKIECKPLSRSNWP